MILSEISKSYGKQTVFENFSLEVREGEILCLLGGSGEGKTTLLNILAGLTPFTGKVEGRKAEEKVSYVFQEPRLLNHLTLRQNLAYVGGDKARTEELLAAVELLPFADKRPAELSGGERQRVSLARAFSVPFDLLLMDEPFSSLDTALKIRLTEVFAKLWRADGETRRTAVFVTHDVEEALMLADRVVVLRGGKVVFDKRLTRSRFPAPYGEDCPERAELFSVLLGEA